MSVEIVPRVCPGVRWSVSVVSPSVELLAFGGHHVLLRLAPRSGGAPKQLPVGLGNHDARVVAVLQERGPADVIVVCVAHEDVLDLGRIEAELAQPADHLVLDRVVENRVDDDDAGRGDDRPGRIFLFADEVEVVEHLDRLGVPGLPRRRPGRARGRGPRRARRRRRRLAQAIRQCREVLAGGRAGRRHVPLDGIRHGRLPRRRSRRDRTSHQQTEDCLHSLLRS